jgi:hypothetical protein
VQHPVADEHHPRRRSEARHVARARSARKRRREVLVATASTPRTRRPRARRARHRRQHRSLAPPDPPSWRSRKLEDLEGDRRVPRRADACRRPSAPAHPRLGGRRAALRRRRTSGPIGFGPARAAADRRLSRTVCVRAWHHRPLSAVVQLLASTIPIERPRSPRRARRTAVGPCSLSSSACKRARAIRFCGPVAVRHDHSAGRHGRERLRRKARRCAVAVRCRATRRGAAARSRRARRRTAH